MAGEFGGTWLGTGGQAARGTATVSLGAFRLLAAVGGRRPGAYAGLWTGAIRPDPAAVFAAAGSDGRVWRWMLTTCAEAQA